MLAAATHREAGQTMKSLLAAMPANPAPVATTKTVKENATIAMPIITTKATTFETNSLNVALTLPLAYPLSPTR